MSKVRLIDADALMEAINTWPKFGVDERCRIVPWSENYEPYIHLRDVVIAITGMPTIEERKAGRWTSENACEFCGFQPWFERDIHTLSFCPNCGADMRGGNHETP